MIIMCDKCRKPASISQKVDRAAQILVITVECHGETQINGYSREFLDSNPDLVRQMDGGIGVAFMKKKRAA